jgi:hypothetical protein
MDSAATGVLGIDVGGTAGIVDPACAAIILSETVPTRAARGGAVVLADTVDLAKRLIAAAERWADACRGLPILPAALGNKAA